MKTNPDETLEEIWAIRRQIAAKLGPDPKRRVAYYQRKQKRMGAKLYQRQATPATGNNLSPG